MERPTLSEPTISFSFIYPCGQAEFLPPSSCEIEIAFYLRARTAYFLTVRGSLRINSDYAVLSA
jgi:hypothetical protein